jgi:hypothetical protein
MNESKTGHEQMAENTMGYNTGNEFFEGKPVNKKILRIEQKIIELSRLMQEAYEEYMIEYTLKNDVLNLNNKLFNQYKQKRRMGMTD